MKMDGALEILPSLDGYRIYSLNLCSSSQEVELSSQSDNLPGFYGIRIIKNINTFMYIINSKV